MKTMANSVLAHRQVDLAAQLVLEVRAAVQARGRVAQRLVGEFTLQQFVGTLLLFDLLERGAQLGLLLALGGEVAPHAAQPACARGVGRHGPAQHGKVAAAAAQFEAVFTRQRLAVGGGRLLGRAQHGRHGGLEEFGVGVVQHLGHGPLQDAGHGRTGQHVAAAAQVLHGEHLAVPRQHG